MVEKKKHVYVIGAGMSGLATALRLSELNVPVTLFERDAVVGGMAGSFSWKEFPHLDYGPHIFHTPDERQAEIWERDYGDLFYKNEFWGKNVKGEKFDTWYDYPLSYDSLQDFPEGTRKQVMKEIEELDESRKASATTYREYVRELVGPTLMELFFVQYPQKLWGVSIDDMTANWAPKRVNFNRTKGHFHAGQWSAVGNQGAGAILERMAKKFVDNGGILKLNTSLTGIDTKGDCITSLTFGTEQVLVGKDDQVVSTMPLPVLAEFLGAKNTLKYRGAKLVFIAAKTPQAIPGKPSFLYYDDPNIIFHRVSEQKKFCPIGFPEDRTVVSAEIAYTKGDARDQTSDEELIEQTKKDLVTVGLLKKDDIYDACVFSLPYVYPLHTKGMEKELAEVRSKVNAYSQLYLIGTGGDFHYADLQILAVKGRDLAERLAGIEGEVSRSDHVRVEGNSFNPIVMFGEHPVSNDMPAFIIAEAGLNHNGSLDIAKQLVDAAKEAGASAVKFQTYKAENRISEKVKDNRYAEELVDTEESMFAMFKRLELSKDDHVALFAHAASVGIPIFSTPFDIESVEMLEELGAPYYKIASMDLVNIPLIKRVAETGKPMIMSTGMSTMEQIRDAVHTVHATGNTNLVLLQCVSSYPASAEDMNLRVMQTLSDTFTVPVGFSDHAIGLAASTVALSLGAAVIERHFTLDRYMEGPDHILSSDTKELQELVRLSKLIPRIKGSSEKRIIGSELETESKFKKGLYAKVDILEGTRITEDMLTIKGPGGAILPKFIDEVIGKTAQSTIHADFPIVWTEIL
jgi:sialic acid synthase SpsE/protoporphyrinogen oxidase